MYFSNVEALKGQLAGESLPPREALGYLLVQAVLWSGLTTLIVALSEEQNSWDLAGDLASLVLVVPGLWLAFHRNGGPEGRDFLGRLVSLAWVVSIRVYVPTLALMVAASFVLAITGPLPDETTWLEILVLLAVEVLFYLRLAKHMGDLASAR